MPFGELLREALASIRAHALRSFLTLLGIIIGVSTIVAVVSIIAGLDGYVKEKVIILSPDTYVVTKFGIIRSREEFLDAVKRKDLDWADYERLVRLLTEARVIAAQVVGQGAVKYRDRRLPDQNVMGTTANYNDAFTLDLAAGRYFIESEARTAQNVAVIGWDIKDELFPLLDPLGREITLNGRPYRVIGLVKKQGRTLGQSQDNRIFIPIKAFEGQFGGRRTLDFLIKARGGVDGVERSADEVRAVMRAARHTPFKSPDPFGLITAETLQDLWRQISGAAFALMILISGVSLGVGGIVIMNIMLVSVLERTQEIGVRKAVGAQESDIRRQFVLEATLLSLGGGVLGALAGGGIALLVQQMSPFPAVVSPAIMLVGLGLSAVVGVLSGLWPAIRASKLDPIVALRTE